MTKAQDKKIAELQKRNDALFDKNTAMKHDFTSLHKKMEKLKKEKEELELHLAGSENNNRVMADEIEELRIVAGMLKQKEIIIERQVVDINKLKSKLSASYDATDNVTADRNKLQHAYNAELSEHHKAEDRLEDSLADVARLEIDLQHQLNRNNALNEENRRLKKENDVWKRDLDEVLRESKLKGKMIRAMAEVLR